MRLNDNIPSTILNLNFHVSHIIEILNVLTKIYIQNKQILVMKKKVVQANC